MADSLLDIYRVLDLTDEKGYLCGKILADLGVDVIKIEKVGGDPGRKCGPFYGDNPGPDNSLYWWAFNCNKRGVTLNIESSDGQEIFKRLSKSCDFVLESFPPGYMESLGLGYSALSQANLKLIMVSITPFGQTGPYKNYKSCDLVSMAMGGIMYLCGDTDRPPVRISCPQAYLHAGAHAAVGAMSALYSRTRTGEGQHVDVSIQASLLSTLMHARGFWDLNRVVLHRGGQIRSGVTEKTGVRLLWQCKDGYVCYNLGGGVAQSLSNQNLVNYMVSEGMATPTLKETDWKTFHFGRASQQQIDQLEEPIGEFLMTHTKAELDKEASERRIILYQVATVEDIFNSPQLASRDFWVEIEHPELNRTITYPGPFIKSTQTPIKLSRRAPLIGEHNEEIYIRELGLSTEDLVILKQAGII